MLDASWDGDSFQWERTYVRTKLLEMESLLSVSVIADLKDSTRHILKVGWGRGEGGVGVVRARISGADLGEGRVGLVLRWGNGDGGMAW